MGVRLYMKLKKNEHAVFKYPLCIDVSDKNIEEIHDFDTSAGEIVCVEDSRKDT